MVDCMDGGDKPEVPFEFARRTLVGNVDDATWNQIITLCRGRHGQINLPGPWFLPLSSDSEEAPKNFCPVPPTSLLSFSSRESQIIRLIGTRLLVPFGLGPRMRHVFTPEGGVSPGIIVHAHAIHFSTHRSLYILFSDPG